MSHLSRGLKGNHYFLVFPDLLCHESGYIMHGFLSSTVFLNEKTQGCLHRNTAGNSKLLTQDVNKEYLTKLIAPLSNGAEPKYFHIKFYQNPTP